MNLGLHGRGEIALSLADLMNRGGDPGLGFRKLPLSVFARGALRMSSDSASCRSVSQGAFGTSRSASMASQP